MFLSFLSKKFIRIYQALYKRYENMGPLYSSSKKEETKNGGKQNDPNICALAAGFIVDELPPSLVPPFMEKMGLEKPFVTHEEVFSKNIYLNEPYANPKQ